MSRCATHGLALAPDGKCVRCRREEPTGGLEGSSAPPLARGGVVAALLAILAACVAVAGYAWRRDHPRDSAGSRVPVVSESPLPRPVPPALAPLATLLPAATPARPAASTSAASPEAHAELREPARLEAAMRRVPVTLYGTAWDPGCARARAWLTERGYAFTDRDVDTDPTAARARSALTASHVVPILDVDGQVLAGFDEARTTRALEYAAARRLQR